MSAQFSLKAKLGMIPKTSVLEDKENKLNQEFKDFTTYSESEELARYKVLESFVTSKEFEDIKKEINAKKYSASDPYEKEKTYKTLKKSKKIKTYYQVKDSKELKDYESFKDSEKLANYLELNQFFTSPEFEDFKKSLVQQKEEKTKEIKDKQANYKQLKNNYKWFFALKKSKQLADFNRFNTSRELVDFQSQKEYLDSINFDSLKADIENQKKEKQHEFNQVISRLNELKGLKKSIKKGEKFAEKDEFENLQKNIQSKKYQNEIKGLKIENLDEYKKLKEFEKLEKSSKIKNYFKFKESEKYKNFLNLDGTEEIESFIELEKEVNSAAFKTQIEDLKKIKFENTAEYQKQKEYKTLKKSAEIKQYFKFKDSEKLAIYNSLHESLEVSDYEALEVYINSEEFKAEKKYLLTKDKFKLSDEYKQAEEFKNLKKSEKIKWYLKLEKQNDFAKLNEWELTFEDHFEGNKLDTDKWMSGYYWGKNLLGDDYVSVNEKQFFKNNNIEVKDSNLKIITKSEKTNGKVWDPSLGFYTKDFDYTSGLVNTGQYFRQQCGLFKAKIKVSHSYPVHHAFWLLGEKSIPEVDVFKYGEKSAAKLEVANYWNGEGRNKKSMGGVNFSKDYFIYSLEWTPEKLVWKINDVVLYEQTEGIPNEPMYLILSSGISRDGNPVLPCTMNIDWVKVYKKME